MERLDSKKECTDFGGEVAKILPLIMRRFASSQHAGLVSKMSLTVPQIIILEFLAEREICKMKELAQALHLTMSAVTAIVDKMIELRMVKRERSSKDRRVVNVIMLNKGKEMLRKVSEARCSCVNELFSTLTQEDRNEYLRILKKVYNNLRQR